MNLVFECIYGSHLYGTDHPNSDKDYKGIYIPTHEDFLFKTKKELANVIEQAQKSKGQRNTKDDVDRDIKELWTFLKDCMSGQTYAIEMLFCPEQFQLKTSPEWEYIQENRLSLITSNIKPYTEFAKNNADRYGLRGEKLKECQEFKAVFDAFYEPLTDQQKGHWKLHDFVAMNNGIGDYKHITHVKIDCETSTGDFIRIFDSNYEFSLRLKTFKDFMDKKIAKAGHRTIQAAEDGGKCYKAISHAYRAIFQLQELLTEQTITFPLKEAEYVRRLKFGKVPHEKIEEELPRLTKQIMDIPSPFPETVDRERWRQWVHQVYRKHHLD